MARAEAVVDLAAIRHNCRALRQRLSSRALLCAVVKADGYGHGAAQAAEAALAGGARYLAVATAQEAVALRQAGFQGVPILVMGPLDRGELRLALAVEAEVVVWREWMVEEVAAAGGGAIHVKFDSGMGRLGSSDREGLLSLLASARERQGVVVRGLMSHLATAGERDGGEYMARQVAEFGRFVAAAKGLVPEAIAHIANSGGLLSDPSSHFEMARCGVALYGLDPFGEDAAARDLAPALSLRSYVADVRRIAAGRSVGYGRRFIASRDTHIAVIPVGYGDGFHRALSGKAEVLIGGRRYRQVGTISMDTITVDLGPDPAALRLRGEEAVLIGSQGEERITAEEVAALAHTINYEVTCGLTARVPRRFTP